MTYYMRSRLTFKRAFLLNLTAFISTKLRPLIQNSGSFIPSWNLDLMSRAITMQSSQTLEVLSPNHQFPVILFSPFRSPNFLRRCSLKFPITTLNYFICQVHVCDNYWKSQFYYNQCLVEFSVLFIYSNHVPLANSNHLIFLQI